jgi:hypothetical protein
MGIGILGNMVKAVPKRQGLSKDVMGSKKEIARRPLSFVGQQDSACTCGRCLADATFAGEEQMSLRGCHKFWSADY